MEGARRDRSFNIHQLKMHRDKRGQLVVFLKKSELPKSCLTFGQVYFVTFSDLGIVRGNHYHKKWQEWAGVVQGKVLVVLKDVWTRRRQELILDEKSRKQVRLEIPPYTAHAFKSLTATASLINYAPTLWSPRDDFEYPLLT